MADRTNGLNNVDIGSGRRGFRNRNLGLGQAGTVVDAEWANGVQEEIVRAIELLGISPSAANREQLIQAIRRMAGGNVTTLTATGTLTADNAGVVLASAAGGNVTLTLPAANAANGAALPFMIVRTDTTANTLTVQRAGSDLIEGASSMTLPVGQRLSLRSDGASAWVIAGQRRGALIGVQVFTASGTYTPTPGMATCIVRCQGGGGAGGGATGAASGNVSLGAPGAAGAFGVGRFTAAQIGASQAVTIGAGGAGVSGGAGGNGGTSSLGTLITAPGGPGGGTLTNQVPPTLSGNGSNSASPTGANIVGSQGAAGSFTTALSSSAAGAAPGGASVFGAGGYGVSINTNGIAGTNAGSGGSGSAVNSGGGSSTGGAGAPGIVIVEEYA